VLTLTASGSVSDYTDSDKSSLQQKVANAAGVDKSLVTMRVTAASVRIIATIAVPASMAPDAVQASLSSTLGTAADASAALGITVEEAPTVALGDDPLRPPDSGSFSCDGRCIGGIVGGCFVPVLVCILCLSGAFAKCGWPSPLKRPTAARGGVADQMVHGWDRGRRQQMDDLGGSELGDLGGRTRPSRINLQTAGAARPMTEGRRASSESATGTARVVRPPSQFSTTVPVFQQITWQVHMPVVVGPKPVGTNIPVDPLSV